jgi:3',5'-cyclic AMP phosphodiesterase CpdA
MPEHDFPKIILRFRDLSVPDTIKRHKDFITNNTKVWWGWWAKPQEKVPLEEFSNLKSLISSNNNIELLLFDSGNKKIYIAKCIDLQYDHTNIRIESPEKQITPEYYREQKYKAWFCFSEIGEEISTDNANILLKKHSYTYIPNLFEVNNLSSSSFDNKIVFSCNELYEQQQTLWFIREKRNTDKLHEIHSYSNISPLGENVDRGYWPLKSNIVLWLSDLHFSNTHHNFISQPGENNNLGTRLKKELDNLEIIPCSLVISGDITYKALKEEFDDAYNFIKDMNSIFSLKGNVYSICPGNHDIAFSSSTDEPNAQVNTAFEDAKANYVYFFKKVYGYEPNDMLYTIKRFILSDVGPIEFININSCVLQQAEGVFQGMGFVGNDQITRIENELRTTSKLNPFRILVLHHHLMPVIFKESPENNKMYEITLDSEAIVQFIVKNNINIVLHGHSHKEFYAEVTRKINDNNKWKYYIAGLGSTGIITGHASDGRQNMFACLVFDKDNLIINGYKLNPNGEKSTSIFSYEIPYNEKEND